jgi:hypothetical protein
MKQIGLLGLCFGILISGVRGQEVVTKTYLTGLPNSTNPIVVQETENLEILSYANAGSQQILFVKSIDWALTNEVPWSPDYYSGSFDIRNHLVGSLPMPVIVSGPAKVFARDEVSGPLISIAYRIAPKAGYSPNISPTSLASNTNFVSGLTQTILSSSNSYGLATRTELIQALAESRADGINSVISNPNLWTLYTTNQIHAMAIGDLVLTSTNNGQFVLNYDIEQSEDLVNWTPYQGFALPLTNLPTNKAFVRIKAIQGGGSYSGSSQTTPTTDLNNPISGGGNGIGSGTQPPGGEFDPSLVNQ